MDDIKELNDESIEKVTGGLIDRSQILHDGDVYTTYLNKSDDQAVKIRGDQDISSCKKVKIYSYARYNRRQWVCKSECEIDTNFLCQFYEYSSDLTQKLK